MAFEDGYFEEKAGAETKPALAFTDVANDKLGTDNRLDRLTATFEANAAYIEQISNYIGQIHLRAAAVHPGGLEAFLADHAVYKKTMSF